MSTSAITAATATPFERFLDRHDEETWSATIAALAGTIHEVDRNATQIWFSFYPLSLFRALAEAEDPEQLAQELLLQGNYRLQSQIDSSHQFLYGHRFWPQVKQAVAQYAENWSAPQSSREGRPESFAARLAEQIS